MPRIFFERERMTRSGLALHYVKDKYNCSVAISMCRLLLIKIKESLMPDPTTRLTLTLDGGPEATAEDVEKLARRLRDELLELEVEAIEPSEKKAPDGSKVGLALDWTTLLVTLAASGGVLTTLIAAIQAWLLRNRETSVTMKTGADELTIAGAGPYSQEQKQAIEQWLSRHKGYVLSDE
jgi:hypothetical protein